MEQRTLPGTDLRVSRLCFGTLTFGGQADEAASSQLAARCFDHGIGFFDTANVYNKGRSEEILGKILQGRRQSVVLASKVRGAMGGGPDDKGLSRAAIVKAIDESLRRLRTDYLDIYYLHQPDYDVPVEETLEAVEELVHAGKVRYPATSRSSGARTSPPSASGKLLSLIAPYFDALKNKQDSLSRHGQRMANFVGVAISAVEYVGRVCAPPVRRSGLNNGPLNVNVCVGFHQNTRVCRFWWRIEGRTCNIRENPRVWSKSGR